MKKSFKFILSENANVIHVRDIEDLNHLPKVKQDLFSWTTLDFEEMVRLGYDAIELHLSDEKNKNAFCEGLYFKLYGWDCDSILILNPDIIHILKGD